MDALDAQMLDYRDARDKNKIRILLSPNFEQLACSGYDTTCLGRLISFSVMVEHNPNANPLVLIDRCQTCIRAYLPLRTCVHFATLRLYDFATVTLPLCDFATVTLPLCDCYFATLRLCDFATLRFCAFYLMNLNTTLEKLHKYYDGADDKNTIVPLGEASKLVLYNNRKYSGKGYWSNDKGNTLFQEKKILKKYRIRDNVGQVLIYCSWHPAWVRLGKHLHLRRDTRASNNALPLNENDPVESTVILNILEGGVDGIPQSNGCTEVLVEFAPTWHIRADDFKDDCISMFVSCLIF
jgi:hypothetical protein